MLESPEYRSSISPDVNVVNNFDYFRISLRKFDLGKLSLVADVMTITWTATLRSIE